jgi:hypothetical protein
MRVHSEKDRRRKKEGRGEGLEMRRIGVGKG